MAGNSTKAIVAAFFANAGIAVAKFVGFIITGSSSMLAESVHSVADSGNQGLLLLGGRLSKRAPSAAHPFGYGRERYFWSFVVALVLFSLGGAFATFEGIEKIRHPHELESLGVAVGILVFGVVLEAFSLRTAVVEARPLRGNATWWQFVRRSRNPELPVVLLEDCGALMGVRANVCPRCGTNRINGERYEGHTRHPRHHNGAWFAVAAWTFRTVQSHAWRCLVLPDGAAEPAQGRRSAPTG